jgi:hypothetical protein
VNGTAPSIEILRCEACGRHVTPPRFGCPHCGSEALVAVRVEGRGLLVSTTTIRRAPTRFLADAPYVVAVVDLDCGARITGRAVDAEALSIDQPVVLVEEVDGIACFGR